MTWIFLVCAVAGGTMLVCQAIMALVGLGGHLMDFDAGGDVDHDLSGDFHDLSGDFHGGTSTAAICTPIPAASTTEVAAMQSMARVPRITTVLRITKRAIMGPQPGCSR